jgi:Spy/CpxP family protein refolding chaperone
MGRHLRCRALAAALLASVVVVRSGGAQPPGRRGDGIPPRARLEQIVRERLALTDEQARRLREVTGRFGRERQQLLAEERDTRRALRTRLGHRSATPGAAVDEQAVAAAVDRLLALQQRRLTLVQEEQRELARFLRPSQRAEFLAMQERASRATQRLRMERERRGAGGPPRQLPP